MIKPFKGIVPKIASTAFVAETAMIIGDVHIGRNSSVWFHTVVRGDVNHIRIGSGTNIQDLSVLHVSGYKDESNRGAPLVIGDNVTIGHSTVIHGCTIENGAFIGMKAMIMDRAVIGSGAMIAAGSLVPEGTVVPAGTLWIGSPAKFKRELGKTEKDRAVATAAAYARLALSYQAERCPEATVEIP